MMTKEAFLLLLDKQRSSGLYVREFCKREGYSLGSYYYWKGKFCSVRAPAGSETDTRSRCAPGNGENNLADILAPVSFSMPKGRDNHANPPAAECAQQEGQAEQALNEIEMELPVGVRIRFRGTQQLQAATRLITQMITQIDPGRVLSE